MRRKDNEISDKEIIFSILKNAQICRIAFNDKKHPYIVPLNYGYKDNALYFHCAKVGKKMDLINIDNNVCFEIVQSREIIKGVNLCDWFKKFRSIIGYGNIEIITDNDEKEKGLDILMQQHGRTENQYNSKITN